MAYTSQGFADGQVLSAAKLTNIEQAILDNDIIAQGTSGGWDYVKYANGVAILFGTFSESDTNYTIYNGMYGYYTRLYSFPFTIIGEPGVGYGAYIGSGFAVNARACVENNGVSFYYLASASGTQTIVTHAIVIGRWK